jgi:hypothetical protein
MAPLAFLSPRIIPAIVDGTASAEALPYSWIEQEQSASDCDVAPAIKSAR